jgi:hypothetical protein
MSSLPPDGLGGVTGGGSEVNGDKVAGLREDGRGVKEWAVGLALPGFRIDDHQEPALFHRFEPPFERLAKRREKPASSHFSSTVRRSVKILESQYTMEK